MASTKRAASLATMQFHTKVFDSLAEILERLQRVEEKIDAITLPPLGLGCEENLFDLGERIGKMEMLLFRMELPEFRKIDVRVEAAAALQEGTRLEHQCEPEKEASPNMLQQKWERDNINAETLHYSSTHWWLDSRDS